MKHRDPTYCPYCGGDDLACGELYANGRVWTCRECKHEFMRDEPKSSDSEGEK